MHPFGLLGSRLLQQLWILGNLTKVVVLLVLRPFERRAGQHHFVKEDRMMCKLDFMDFLSNT